MKLFLLIIRHLTNVSLARFDPIRPQDCKIVDQSSALLACDLCGESEMSMSNVGKKWREGHFWGAVKKMVNSIVHYYDYHSLPRARRPTTRGRRSLHTATATVSAPGVTVVPGRPRAVSHKTITENYNYLTT
jgi:hypothetical protein